MLRAAQLHGEPWEHEDPAWLADREQSRTADITMPGEIPTAQCHLMEVQITLQVQVPNVQGPASFQEQRPQCGNGWRRHVDLFTRRALSLMASSAVG